MSCKGQVDEGCEALALGATGDPPRAWEAPASDAGASKESRSPDDDLAVASSGRIAPHNGCGIHEDSEGCDTSGKGAEVCLVSCDVASACHGVFEADDVGAVVRKNDGQVFGDSEKEGDTLAGDISDLALTPLMSCDGLDNSIKFYDASGDDVDYSAVAVGGDDCGALDKADEGEDCGTTDLPPTEHPPSPSSSSEELPEHLEETSVTALLTRADVFDELESSPERLQWLCSPSSTFDLARLLTQLLPEVSEAEEQERARAACVATELLTREGYISEQLCEAFISGEGADSLDCLWDFAEHSTPTEVNSPLASYFARVANALFSHYPAQVAWRLRCRGGDALLAGLLERLHSDPLAELLLQHLHTSCENDLVFPTDNLVTQLLDLLEEHGCECRDNIRRVLDNLLEHRSNLCFGGELVRQVTSEGVVNRVLANVLDSKAGVVWAGASAAILASIISRLHPSRSESMLDEEEAEEQTHSSAAAMISRVCGCVPQLTELLRYIPEQRPMSASSHGPRRSVGSVTLEVVSLIVTIARIGSPAVIEALGAADALPCCLDLLLAFPWSGVLHNAVAALICEALAAASVEPASEASELLMLSLLDEGQLAEKMAAEFTAEVEWRQRPRRMERAAYMGHLHLICGKVADFCSQTPKLGAALFSAPSWSEVVVPSTQLTHRAYNEELGGPRPGHAPSEPPDEECAAPGPEAPVASAVASPPGRIFRGAAVVVMEEFLTNSEPEVQLRPGMRGIVSDIDEDGDAEVDFSDLEVQEWVSKDDFDKLFVVETSAVVEPDGEEEPHEHFIANPGFGVELSGTCAVAEAAETAAGTALDFQDCSSSDASREISAAETSAAVAAAVEGALRISPINDAEAEADEAVDKAATEEQEVVEFCDSVHREPVVEDSTASAATAAVGGC